MMPVVSISSKSKPPSRVYRDNGDSRPGNPTSRLTGGHHPLSKVFVATVLAVVLLLLPTDITIGTVDGHATLLVPRSGNTYAFQVGQRPGDPNAIPGLPRVDYDPYGYQAGGYDFGACGERNAGSSDDYTDNYVDAYGNPADWFSQATYFEGQVIETVVDSQANHEGYFEFYVCPDVTNPTQECFDLYPLDFVADVYYGAPIQPEYPNRGYQVRPLLGIRLSIFCSRRLSASS